MIFISAGHHELSQGAKYNDFTEWKEAVLWRDEISSLLGCFATLVPSGKLQDKVAFINRRAIRGDLAMEIHFNSAKNSYGVHVGSGSETLYCPNSNSGRVVAEQVQAVMETVWPPSRGVKEGWYQMNPAKGANYFLAKTACTAVIIEPEFVQNYEMINERRLVGCQKLAEFLAHNVARVMQSLREL